MNNLEAHRYSRHNNTGRHLGRRACARKGVATECYPSIDATFTELAITIKAQRIHYTIITKYKGGVLI
ncbi:hypothetical protein D9M69_567830 [compost metagenome]